jgi:hypothetical protein
LISGQLRQFSKKLTDAVSQGHPKSFFPGIPLTSLRKLSRFDEDKINNVRG